MGTTSRANWSQFQPVDGKGWYMGTTSRANWSQFQPVDGEAQYALENTWIEEGSFEGWQILWGGEKGRKHLRGFWCTLRSKPRDLPVKNRRCSGCEHRNGSPTSLSLAAVPFVPRSQDKGRLHTLRLSSVHERRKQRFKAPRELKQERGENARTSARSRVRRIYEGAVAGIRVSARTRRTGRTRRERQFVGAVDR
jgi:hypothetical protein